jgi:hypothetical protein
VTPVFGRAGSLRQLRSRRTVRRAPEFSPQNGIVTARGQRIGCSCGGHHDTVTWPWDDIGGPMVFTYQAGYEDLGNVLLRAHQVADLLSDQAPPFPIYSQSLENLYLAKPRGRTIVVTKTGVKLKHLGLLTALKKAGNLLIFDMVDGVLPAELENLPDAYGCSSVTELEARHQAGHKAFASLHAPDHRTPRRSFDSKEFGIVYFGMAENARHLGDIDDVVALGYEDMPAHREVHPLPTALGLMAEASHHYSIRQWNPRDGFKPLTKAAVAGTFGACIIASADEYEAVALLGADYPYLAPSSELDDVTRTVEFAKSSYLSDTWQTAVERMVELTRKTCPVASAHQLVTGIADLHQGRV